MPLIPFAALPNSTALSTSVCGAWSVATASAVPSSSATRQAAASTGAAQRRVDARRRSSRAPPSSAPSRPRVARRAVVVERIPRPAPRAGDPLVGQREVVRRDVAGDRQAARLRVADQLERRGRGDMRQVEPRAGDVARRPRRGSRSPARPRLDSAAPGQPRSPRIVATSPSFASAPSVRRRVLGMVDDRQPERARVRQRVAQDRRGADRRPVVAEPDRAGVRQLADRGEGLPRPAGRHRADRPAARPATRTPTAAARIRASTPGSSSAGVVFGIAQTVVKPPWAAAASPLAIVSASSLPGSRRWACRSMKPGATTTPRRVDAVRVRAVEPRDRLEDPVAHHDLARALAAGRRVDQPGPPDVEVRHLAASPAPTGLCVPASR